MKSEDQLKAEYLSWLESIKLRRFTYEQTKKYLKQVEEDLRIAKRNNNWAYKNWKEARQEAIRTKRKWKGYSYQMRSWAKKHMDKVFELLEKTE
jgi:hypothetical protein